MRYVSFRSASFTAAIAIAAMSIVVIPVHAQQTNARNAAAAQQGPADVNVVNVPTVTVANTNLQPIPVKEPVKEPLLREFQLQIVPPHSVSQAVAGFVIPAGKRLTVEHTSFICAHDRVQEGFWNVVANGTGIFLPAQSFPIESGTTSMSIGAAPLSVHLDGGSVTVNASRSTSNGTSNCWITVAGYLTPLQ